MIKYRKKIFLIDIIIVLLFFLIWELLSSHDVINSFIFSSPSKMIKSLYTLAITGNLSIHILTTLKEIIISFSLGLIISFLLSIVLYYNKVIRDVLDPFLTMLNSLPKVALGPIIIIWAGANTKSIILMAVLTNAIVSTITISNIFLNTDKLKIKLFRSFNASKLQILFGLVIPSNISSIISSLKVNISLTLIGVIMGEFLVSKKGLGYLILYGTQIFDLNIVMGCLLILIIISFILYKLIVLIENNS